MTDNDLETDMSDRYLVKILKGGKTLATVEADSPGGAALLAWQRRQDETLEAVTVTRPDGQVVKVRREWSEAEIGSAIAREAGTGE